MKVPVILLFSATLLILTSAFTLRVQTPPDDALKNYCVSSSDKKLYTLLNSYRRSLRLDSIPLSRSLSYVAFNHTLDLSLNHPDKKPCNLHSWSNRGAWKPCCYTPDHKQAPCMWNKPMEIAGMASDGFEIAAWYSGKETPEMALNQWKSSPGHHAVLANKGMWAGKKWKSVGVSVYGNYAVIWFSEAADTLPVPAVCGE